MTPALLILLACHNGSIKLLDDTGEVEQIEDSVPVVEDSVPPVDTSPPETVPEEPDEADQLFDTELVHEIEITLGPDQMAAITALPFEFTEGQVTIDGEDIGSIGVRIKGKYGTYRDITQKPSLKLDFNRYQEGYRFLGLEKLNLNNSIVDCSYIKDRVSQQVFGQVGLPSLRTGFATVTVNGADYGLYVTVEAPDDRWLNRTFDQNEGNFYDGKYLMSDDWSWYTFVDFSAGLDDYFRLDEGTDVGLADIKAITAALASWNGVDDGYTALDGLLDWDEVLLHLAVEQWLGQNDGYALNQNNYFIYFDPSDGRARMTTWDLDYTYLHAEDWGYSWKSPRGALAGACYKDDACKERWAAAVATVIEGIDTQALQAYIDEISAVSETAAYADPKRECTSTSIGSYRDLINDWNARRSGEMARFWDL